MTITSTMTAGELVTMAMQERRALAAGRSPTAWEMAYGLKKLDLLLKPLARYEGTQWAPEEATATITAGNPSVTLTPRPGNVVSVRLILSATNERTLTEWEGGQYDVLPNKTSVGDPTIYVERETSAGVSLVFWPVPSANRTIKYRYIRVPEDVAQASAVDVPQDWLDDILNVLADNLTVFANSNPDLPGKAAVSRRLMEDRARPRSYTFEPDCA